MEIHSKIIKVLRKINAKGNIDIKKLNELSFEEQELIRNLFEGGLIKDALSFIDSVDVDKNWEELQSKLKQKTPLVVPLWKKSLKYAALFVGIIGIVFLFQYKNLVDTEIKLNGDEIQLVLENGDVQILNSNGEGKVISKNGHVVGSQKGKELKYNSKTGIEELVYNQIKIPYGKTFNVTLSDGTHISLNSGSVLRYPVKFIKGMNRVVYLEGEAFFDVTKDKLHPFIVNVNSLNVKVLGTKFNVSSYAEDKEVSAVLVEGSVSLNNDMNPAEKVLLTPGYKGSWEKSGSGISLEKVDTSLYTNWMKGEINFKSVVFREIIKKLERTYNVKIINNYKKLDDIKLSGSFDKNIESIDGVMESMSKIQSFNYKLTENHTIIITK